MLCTRRELGGIAIAGLAGSRFNGSLAATAQARPNSRVAGVQIALNAPYSFRNAVPILADDILRHCQQLGLSALELRVQPIEAFLGSPAPYPPTPGGRGAAPPPPPTPEQIAARRAAADDLRRWRLSLPMSRVREFRQKYADAGVAIDIVKVDWFDEILTLSDEEVRYFFDFAKNLGARAISCELLDFSVIGTRLLGSLAEEHKLPVAYHGHGQSPAIFEKALSYSKYNAANIDLGHFVAANNVSPVELFKKIHDRITHVHVKDRKMNNGPNMPFGQGDTPIKEVLQLIRDNRWNITATIEYEYPVPQGSNVLAEIARSVQYCKDCLLS